MIVGLHDIADDPALFALCKLGVVEAQTRPLDAFLRADLPRADCVVEQAFVLRRSTLCARLRADNGGDSLAAPRGPGWEGLFTTRYAGRDANVVFATRVVDLRLRPLRGLWAELGRQPMVVVSPDGRLTPDDRAALSTLGIVYISVRDLVLQDPPSLHLPWMWPRLAPELFADPSQRTWLAADVRLSLGEAPNREHIVLVNGHRTDAFARSDLAFAQLLRLASARQRAEDLVAGGRVPIAELDASPGHRRLDALRQRFARSVPRSAGGGAEGRHFIRTTYDGAVRLALLPDAIELDASLRAFAPLRTLASGTAPDRKRGELRAITLVERALSDARLDRVAAIEHYLRYGARRDATP